MPSHCQRRALIVYMMLNDVAAQRVPSGYKWLDRQAGRAGWTDLKEALMALLDEETIARELTETPGWERAGDSIVATVVLADFKAAMVFVNRIAELAEAADHHPDITIRWNKVTLTLSTHSAGGLTEKDFDLARQISAF
jgi:4a-hydroxytetrahydrobiopterin dehydratase